MTGGAQDSGAAGVIVDALFHAHLIGHGDFRDEAVSIVARHMPRATPAPAGWQPRIGEEVRVSEETAARWPDWRDTRLWVVGVSMDRNVSGTPTEGLNVCVSDEWPVTNRTGSFTDGFFINRPYAGDDLRPIPTAPAEGGV